VGSQMILELVKMVRIYNKRPSELIGIQDDAYTAYCLDEACALIIFRMDNGEEPVFRKHYTSFSAMYKNFT
jgi:hypothetical protein